MHSFIRTVIQISEPCTEFSDVCNQFSEYFFHQTKRHFLINMKGVREEAHMLLVPLAKKMHPCGKKNVGPSSAEGRTVVIRLWTDVRQSVEGWQCPRAPTICRPYAMADGMPTEYRPSKNCPTMADNMPTLHRRGQPWPSVCRLNTDHQKLADDGPTSFLPQGWLS